MALEIPISFSLDSTSTSHATEAFALLYQLVEKWKEDMRMKSRTRLCSRFPPTLPKCQRES